MTIRPPQPAPAGPSTAGGRPGGTPPGAGGLAGAAETVAGLTSAALEGGIGETAALASLSAVRRLAVELERGELALIEAARDGGAAWSQISSALGTRNRQTAQKRHADLARRCPRPPSVDTPQAKPAPAPPSTRTDGRQPEAGPPAGEYAPVSDGQLPGQLQLPLATAADLTVPATAPSSSPGHPATPRRRTAAPRITGEVIAEGLYEFARTPDYAETRAWLVLVGGRAAGLVRPTWHGERSRPAWEPVDLSGLALPVKGTGRVTPAGNARTRDAAAVSLLRALQRQQDEEHKQRLAARSARSPRTETA